MSALKFPTLDNTFASTSPYSGSWVQEYFPKIYNDVFGSKIVREADFREKILRHQKLPGLLAMWNMIADRPGILSLCRELKINTVHVEDGFFPHYNAAHADPLGFCWESSLPRLVYCGASEAQIISAKLRRDKWIKSSDGAELPSRIRPPYVLWPLQLIGDKVNQCDLNLQDWTGLLRHFRACLPEEFQLVIRHHPRSKGSDCTLIEDFCLSSPNTLLLPRAPTLDLQALIKQANAVAGANSSVLLEARLMFHKPVYAYARSWYENHNDLFLKIHDKTPPRALARLDWLYDNSTMRSEYLNDYTDWFLSQLIARQLCDDRTSPDPIRLKRKVEKMSYQSFLTYGEEIFLPDK